MQSLAAGLGRRPDLTAELDGLGDPTLTAARVLAQHRGRWLVAEPDADGAEPRLVPARGRLRDDGVGVPVAGDWVALDAGGAIAAVLERRGAIVRRAPGEATAAQALAANVDLALVVEPLPAPNERRAERFAALAAAGGVPVALVLTKADLDDDAYATASAVARRIGVLDALPVGALAGDGLAPLRALLEPGATAVLLGPSGAGKSTLVNALAGEARMATGAVRDDGRGRHTTVTRELVPLPGGALLVDTPGLREVGLWDGAGASFADVDALAAGCRFADCRHEGEPACAVRGAVPAGRLESWRKLEREQAWIDDRRAAARAREASGRGHVKAQRAARRAKGNRA
ncbi:MAG TPA: ribosome small subunit-dependent GTPase A [Capillimicrobium sp.]|jgi:ribosome biogenesis GTPase